MFLVFVLHFLKLVGLVVCFFELHCFLNCLFFGDFMCFKINYVLIFVHFFWNAGLVFR